MHPQNMQLTFFGHFDGQTLQFSLNRMEILLGKVKTGPKWWQKLKWSLAIWAKNKVIHIWWRFKENWVSDCCLTWSNSSIFFEPHRCLMVSVLASSAVDRVFESWSDQTKDDKIGICCFSAKHAALRRKQRQIGLE
jgi:hypothetical protein